MCKHGNRFTGLPTTFFTEWICQCPAKCWESLWRLSLLIAHASGMSDGCSICARAQADLNKGGGGNDRLVVEQYAGTGPEVLQAIVQRARDGTGLPVLLCRRTCPGCASSMLLAL